MRTSKNARLLFISSAIGWSLVFYVSLMIMLNWNDIGKKQQVVVTSEPSQSIPTQHPSAKAASTSVIITEGNG